MHAIIISDNGIIKPPLLIEEDIIAKATFEILAMKLLKKSLSEINLDSKRPVDSLNRSLEGTGITVEWFRNIDVNGN